MIRSRKQKNKALNRQWLNNNPFKISLLSWRLYLGKLPFDDIIAKFGNQIVSRCMCCQSPKEDTIQHVFIEGDTAKFLWNTFGAPIGIKHENWPVRRALRNWWDGKPKNKIHIFILRAVPLAINWKIWKNWRTCRYGDQKKFQPRKMEYQVMWTVQAALSMAFPKCNMTDSWPIFCEKVERWNPTSIVHQVTWQKPPNGRIKINTDGSYLHETGSAGIGGIARNEEGDLIMAFSLPVQSNTNNSTEAMAAKVGIQWCIQQGYNDFYLEIDLQIVANMLNERYTDNLHLKDLIDEITRIMHNVEINIAHYFREANQVADTLAKNAAKNGSSGYYYTFQQLPGNAKGPFQLDKWQLPSFRIRYDKANFFVS
ncbi:PREDICTED: uncharacterized protein LOC109217719 [Nicotiana attenuata]|uniref:uncharacterized protein LOC109217719 n=1 Tax=Nicotiana attenuata TaxID=49451 RepID=UPI00090560BD|nr:PREDICTED: uncharacterized protein LOC109217719 [Nicotiana attenuata]